MYRRLERVSREEGLTETMRALPYAREKHAGQFRKAEWGTTERIPYLIHPLLMACHAHALGLTDDRILTVILLHDVCEDCGVLPEELPFSDEVKLSVALLTKKPDPELSKAENTALYYQALSLDPVASIVKILDRCNNVSTMARCFSREKMISYINETEEWVLPLMQQFKYDYTEYSDAAFIVKYHILSVIESLKVMLMRPL